MDIFARWRFDVPIFREGFAKYLWDFQIVCT